MHVLLATTPAGGHQPPMVGLGQELARRGHRLTYYTGAKYRGAADQCGATWLPWTSAQDFDDLNPRKAFPALRPGDGPVAVMDSFDKIYFATGPGQLADVARLHSHDPVDVVVGQDLCLAAPFLHDACGVPWASFSFSPLSLTNRNAPPSGLGVTPGRGPLGHLRDAILRGGAGHTMGAWMRRSINRARRRARLAPTDLPGFDSLHSHQLHLAQGIPALEFPRPDAPRWLHLIGDAAQGTRTTDQVPRWLENLAPDRPVVHVTAGTLDITGDLYRIAVEALAGTDAQVVIAGDPARIPAAANVIAPGWVPYDLLLPRCQAIVSNGGYGAVLSGLAAGVPVVVAPAGRDKPEIATRVAHAGAGINLHRANPRPDTLRRAVRDCLQFDTYRQAATDAATQFREAGGAPHAADLIEQAAA